MLNKQNRKSEVIQKIEDEEFGAFITKIGEIANQLHSYHCKIGKNLSKNYKKHRNHRTHPQSQTVSSIFFKPVLLCEVKETILSLKNESCGFDRIHA